jgi:hypothetical protein
MTNWKLRNKFGAQKLEQRLGVGIALKIFVHKTFSKKSDFLEKSDFSMLIGESE